MSEPFSHESLVQEMENLEKTLSGLKQKLEESLSSRQQVMEDYLRAYA